MLLALVPVWGVLFLAEHYRWLPKGYPVLVAAATFVVLLVLLVLWLAAALVFRWRFQFTVRSLLLLTVIVSIWGSWFGVEMRTARRQREAVEAMARLGGSVCYDYLDLTRTQPWLRNLLGEDFFGEPVSVDLRGADVMEEVGKMSQVTFLELSGTQVTDSGLVYLHGLRQLRKLTLYDTHVTDGGLKNLRRALPSCEVDALVTVAHLSVADKLTENHIDSLLRSNGIVPVVFYELTTENDWWISVSRQDAKMATRLLREDSKKRSYRISFGDEVHG